MARNSESGEPGRSIIERLGSRGIAAIVLGIVAVVFIVENTHHTSIRFIGPRVSAPLWLALLISAALGGLAGALITYRRTK